MTESASRQVSEETNRRETHPWSRWATAAQGATW